MVLFYNCENVFKDFFENIDKCLCIVNIFIDLKFVE